MSEHDAPHPTDDEYQPPNDSDVLTVDEAAAYLRVGRQQLYDAIGRLEVPHRRIGRVIRLSRAALARWLDRVPA